MNKQQAIKELKEIFQDNPHVGFDKDNCLNVSIQSTLEYERGRTAILMDILSKIQPYIEYANDEYKTYARHDVDGYVEEIYLYYDFS